MFTSHDQTQHDAYQDTALFRAASEQVRGSPLAQRACVTHVCETNYPPVTFQMLSTRTAVVVLTSVLVTGCAHARIQPDVLRLDRSEELDAISRAQVWQPTDVAAMDLRHGPLDREPFPPGATIKCRYVAKEMDGRTPKFTCAAGDEELKVKYGRDNGEVYAEVAATRLLWALGFGADHVYPVRVVCTGCPSALRADHWEPAGEAVFEYATVERKMRGRELQGPEGEGWSWADLDRVSPARGGASEAQRDALKLLAVLLQHTDSKREQQRLACLQRDGNDDDGCARPFLLINDLGKTFGKANAFNRDAAGSVNLKAWRETSVWRKPKGCVGNLPKSLTGTLNNPVISEAGRRFLAARLTKLTHRQMTDLFAVARFDARERARGRSQDSTQAWVDAFKTKVVDIVSRDCSTTPQEADAR